MMMDWIASSDNLIGPRVHRWLQSTTTTTSDGAVLRATFVVYGSLLLGMFIAFCFLRRKFQCAYQVRNWVPDIKTSIAEDQYGLFSWMWQLNSVTDDEIMMECGMDSVCLLRLLLMGYKICLLAIFNAIWLMPLYATASSDNTDPVISVTVANVPDRSARFIGTVLATYVLFGYVMYLILQEFEWFIEMRHKYLKRPVVENFSVYVRNIPPEYCTNAKLYTYFADCFTREKVLEAKVRIKLPSLVKSVRKRDLLVKKLGHAINYQLVKGQTPSHTEMRLMKREKVESIPHYVNALREANIEVSNYIERVESEIMNHGAEDFGLTFSDNRENECTVPSESLRFGPNFPSSRFSVSSTRDDSTSVSLHSGKPPSTRIFTFSKLNDDVLITHCIDEVVVDKSNELQTHDSAVIQRGVLPVKALSVASQAATVTALAFGNVASKSANRILSIREEGDYYNSGFVTFSCLGTTQAALQMVHHETPFDIEVLEAPRPDDIFWSNVGRSHHDLQVGKLISLCSTIALCLLWTIPMTFIASLSSVEALSTQIPALGDLIEEYPFIGKLCEVLAPLLVKVVNGLLPTILEYLTKFEGPVSGSIIVASLFTKLAAFMIIQTFFVSAVGSSILQEIEALIESPTSIVNILATSLPSQSTYFIQIVFVSTAFSMGFEILRVIPLIFAFIRRFLPPNLTEEERQTTVFGMFRPLADPDDFGHADSLAQITLNFIIMLVYATIAPLTVFIQGFCFLFMMICYKHQFVYIYPSNSDSGGKIWTNFISVLLPCLLIAQFTIVGLLALKQSVVATPMMIPLIAVTILFNAYVRQQHFRVAEYLPSRECVKADLSNGPDFDFSFTRNAYLQEELKEKVAFPGNVSEERARELGLLERTNNSNH